MSTILITEHNENVYNLIKPEPQRPPPKKITKPRYVQELLAQEKLQLNKYPHKTMGYAEVPLSKPTQFMKKHHGVQRPKIVVVQCHRRSGLRPSSQRKFKKLDTSKHQEVKETQAEDTTDKEPLKEIECTQITKPADAKKTQPLASGKKSAKNFIRKNCTFVKELVPLQAKRCYIDTNKGAVHELKPSGFELNYALKKAYGKLPNYMSLKNAQEKDLANQIMADLNRKKPEGRYITQPERKALLDGLKHNWAEVQKQYLLLPIIIDTVPKKMRKLKLEKELMDLEKDIKTIEEHPYIFVTDADVPEFVYEPESED